MIELRLDHDSPVPLKAQVEVLLRAMVDEPEYRGGKLLPDELSLARRLGVSRTTIRAGIARLVHEGLIERRPGIGTRVAQQRTQSGIGEWLSFTHEMARRGIAVQTFLSEVAEAPAPEEVAAALQIGPGTPALRLDRLRGWEAEPAVYFRSWLHPRLGLTASTDFTAPLYQVIEEQTSVIVDQAHEEMEAVSAEPGLARALGVSPGTPLLCRRRTVYDPGRKPVEYAVVHYRSDRFTLTLDIRRERS